MTDDKDKVFPQRKNSGGTRKRSHERRGGAATAPPPGAADDKGETAAARRNRRFSGIRPRISIEELRNAFKRQASIPQEEEDMQSLFDPLAKAQESKEIIRGKTGIVYDEYMAQHSCLWDPNYPECPERLLHSLNRCMEMGLLSRCDRLDPLKATEQEILKLHTRTHLDLLHYTKGEKDINKLEALASHYDSVYIHPETYEVALLAVGSTLALVDGIASGKLQNGMALIRPPGHHAMKAEYCGYCFFNNVALAAQRALEQHNMSRVLIVDWDVHHGQGTQQMFYEDPRVLYFSIHRYENGSFWPELRESDYNNIGSGPGKGFNFNLPLNKTGMKNEDYLAIFHQVLLPVAYEFDPELILVSSGYDSAVGDEKGEMMVTPAFYAHLTSSLMALAQGRVAVILEGGYCLESTAEGSARTLGALLGEPCPPLMNPIAQPCQSLQESVLNLIYVQRPFWKCFQYQSSFSVHEETAIAKHIPSITYLGKEAKPATFETRNFYPQQSPSEVIEKKQHLKKLIEIENIQHHPKYKLCLVYDEDMSKHRNTSEKEHPERPERTQRIWQYLKQFGIIERALILQSRKATRQEIASVHTEDHINFMFSLDTLKEESLQNLQEKYKSVYLHPASNDAALLSAGSLLQVVDSVCSGVSQGGIGIVRPPGHHAENDHPHGFCLYNNVAVAAKYAIEIYGYKRVMILDWDVHHGNGIQHTFESDPSVLYLSIHRYDDGLFFPSSEDANYDRVGTGRGEGFNVNIPWNKSGMGDAEYMSAMLQVVMPIAYQYDPQLVLIAAGFDAARGDPLGGCCVSPECYGHMTHLLSSLAGSRIILALEGGYNLNVISYCMTMCAKAILGDPLPSLDNNAHIPNKRAVQTISDVIKTHSQYWSGLCFQVALPVEDVLSQGFGSIPQAVESGVSGSELSSCNSSPVSTPSTGGSPMYVSAPSSPDKPWKEKKLEYSILAKTSSLEYETEMCVGQLRVTSPDTETEDLLQKEIKAEKANSSVNSSPDYTTPTSTPKLKPPLRMRRSSHKSNTPLKEQQLESPKDETDAKTGTYLLPPGRSRKPRRSGNTCLATAAAASSGIVKKSTLMVLNENADIQPFRKEFVRKVLNHCHELELLESCTRLLTRTATEVEIPFIFKDGKLEGLSTETENREVLRGIGSTIDLMSEVVSSKCQNGLAVIQLPENLASIAGNVVPSYLNIAAVGAKHAIDSLNINRVMVVDLDTSVDQCQHVFYNDKRILSFSLVIHRDNQQKGSIQKSTKCCDVCDSNFNINLDCHTFQMEDYLAIFHQIILPVAYEFSPELIIISTRYEMVAHSRNIFPIVYTKLIGLLMTLARGRVTVLSTVVGCEEVAVEGIAATLSALQDIPCNSAPALNDNSSPLIKAEILNVLVAKRNAWKCLQFHAQTSCALSHTGKPNLINAEPCTKEDITDFKKYDKKYVHRLCLVYDDSMMDHFNYQDKTHPECPQRINSIYQHLLQSKIVERCHRIKSRQATVEELENLHSSKHLRMMASLSCKKPSELQNLQENYESVFFHQHTNTAALTAAGSVVAVVDSVLKGESLRGLAVVRPPGHHAERNEPCGFCFYNNVAVGAKHAINTFGLKRVLILDWDVHHGNGIQHMFESEPRVLYISIHRYDNGNFFPGSSEANYNRVGIKKGKGFNINIPWNKRGMGDGDYLAAMIEVVLPVSYQFNPQLVLVSAGFDAAVGDPLGGCFVTPQCYGHMTKLLMTLSEGKVVIALEGGYNLSTISYSMAMCAKALLGDPIVSLPEGLVASQSAVDTLTNVISTHRKFWSSLDLKNSTAASSENAYSLPSPLTDDCHKSKLKEGRGPSPSTLMDELSANLSGVTLEDNNAMEVILKTKQEGINKFKMEVKSLEASSKKGDGEEESTLGAVGGPLDNVNTFLLSQGADVAPMYAVVPLEWCPHLERIKAVPSSGLNTAQQCEECQSPLENWVCLSCFKVFCGRFVNEHMLMHGVTEEHYLVLSFSDLSVWCYACDAYVHHALLEEAKRAAHINKFGEDIPNSSASS